MPHLLILLLVGLLTAIGLHAQEACQAPIILQATTNQNQALLRWKPAWDQTAWRVQSATQADFTDSTNLGTALAPAWNWQLLAGEPSRFFRVQAVDGPPLPVETPIETFEWMPPLHSWPGEDLAPEDWEQDFQQAAEGQASLRLFGNTVKAQWLGGPRLDFGETWSVAARVSGVADRQMIGFADSVNVMWYVLWGQRGGYGDTPGQSGQIEVSCYQGWFPQDQWVEALLPLGQDWQGKFGYLPRLCRVLWANESDTAAGQVWFDNLRRVDPAAAAPVSAPLADVLGQTGDSLQVRLRNAQALEGQSQTWSLGDGRRLAGDDLTVNLLAARDHRISLLVESADGRWDAASAVVEGGGSPRRVTLAFGGDVMTARAYEAAGGIIPTQGVDAIFDSIRAELQAVDLALVNLECPYTTATTRHPTKSIAFKSQPQNLIGVINAGVDQVSLANNHVFDYMEGGMLETMALLDGHGLPWTGSGLNSIRARRPSLLSADGLGIGVAAFCDRTGNYNNAQPYLDAGLSRPGFSLWSRGDMQAVLPALTDAFDLVVLQVHSGNEYSTQPSGSMTQVLEATGEDRPALPPVDGAALQAEEGLPHNPEERGLFARELLPDQTERALRREAVDLGARLVITHHPHIVQGFEVYHDGLIAHSLGNLVMDLSYQETMPSVLLGVADDGQALQSAWVTPVFIENYKPRVCRGETATLLLDHVARISRPFHTWVLEQPGAGKAWIALDTLALQFTTATGEETLPLELRSGWYTSPPLRLSGEGELAQLRLLSAATGAQIRLGRDQCWWGNMEDEGAGLWDINSAQEGFVTDMARRGARSLRITESGGASNYVYYTVRAPLDLVASWSLLGWLRTQNASSADLQIRYYNTRSSNLLSSATLPTVSGTAEWTRVWQDLSPPTGANFYQLRLGLTASAAASTAWFDDVSLVEWDAWQGMASQVNLPLRVPNDLQWVQLRVPAAAASLLLEWTRQTCGNPPAGL
jgi:poly-gamma-glutamate capsule biosynthesis protein CapA/YwtB (metallophosphatase superfamily)